MKNQFKNKTFELSAQFEAVEKSGEINDQSTLRIRGYANTTSKDRSGDVIVKEAWTKGGMDDYLKNPIILAFHDYEKPIGQCTGYTVTEKGLEIQADISRAAGKTYDLIKDGVLKTFSVGFQVKDADYSKDDDTFYIKDLNLYEISVVSVPANQDSTFSLAKSFDSAEEYDKFRKSFVSVEQDQTEEEKAEAIEAFEMVREELNPQQPIIEKESQETSQDILKELNMDKKELQDMMSSAAQAAVESYKTEVAEKEAKATAEKEFESIKVEKTRAEKVAEALEAKIKEKDDNYAQAVAEMSSELKAAKEELEAMQKSKMQWSEVGSDKPSEDELTRMFITAKALNKDVKELSSAKQIIEKSTRFSDTDWETTWNGMVMDQLQNRVVVENVFQTMQMNARVMNFPSNPDTGKDATWVDGSTFNDGNNVGTAFNDASSGTTKKHALSEVTLTAHKLATREYIGYEEEEDAIVPIANIIRDAIVRRMARTSDASILGTGVTAPFTELEENAGGNSGNNVATADASTTISVANLLTARSNMGQWGHNPADLVVFMHQDAYYGLMDETSLVTVDKYGPQATILTGEVGRIYGMPIIVSDAFEAAGSDEAQAIIVNPSNYVVGNWRGLTIETARDVVAQQRALVATRRFGFVAKESGAAGKASMCLLTYGG